MNFKENKGRSGDYKAYSLWLSLVNIWPGLDNNKIGSTNEYLRSLHIVITMARSFLFVRDCRADVLAWT